MRDHDQALPRRDGKNCLSGKFLHSPLYHEMSHARSDQMIFGGQGGRFPYQGMLLVATWWEYPVNFNVSKMTVNCAPRPTSRDYYRGPDSGRDDPLLSEVSPNGHLDPQPVTSRCLSADKKSGVTDDWQITLKRTWFKLNAIVSRFMSVLSLVLKAVLPCSIN